MSMSWRDGKRFRLGRVLFYSRGWRVVRWLFSSLALLLLLPTRLLASDIKSDEYVRFYPGLGQWTSDGRVAVTIDLWVYEKERRPGVNSLFARYLSLDLDSLSEVDRARYESRTQLFRIDSERHKQVWVQFNGRGQVFPLARTDSDGRSRTPLMLERALVMGGRETQASDQPMWVNFQAILPTGDDRSFSGQLLVLPEQGLSLISDIDDTIKNSNVTNTKALLFNTFVYPFHPVHGMAAYYRELQLADQGVAFHYVSSSPHQLYPALAGFLSDEQFPDGSVHLRDISLLDEVFGEGHSRLHKITTISAILERFPKRRFVLVGDSGEADPEIYGEIARKFPQQILAILIRNVDLAETNSSRYQQAFAGLRQGLWHVFDDPAQLPSLAELGEDHHE